MSFSRTGTGEAGIKAWVVTAGAKGEATSAATHHFKFTVTSVRPDDNSDAPDRRHRRALDQRGNPGARPLAGVVRTRVAAHVGDPGEGRFRFGSGYLVAR